MDVSYIIVNYNLKEDIINCINSIKKYSDKDIKYEIVIVDNNSKDGSLEIFSKRKDIVYLYQEVNLGFGKANNIGVQYAKGKNIIFINPDVVLTSNSKIATLLKILNENSKIGLLSTKIMYGDGSLQTMGNKFPTVFNSVLYNIFFWNYKILKNLRYKLFFKEKGLREVDWVSGAFFCTSKKNFIKVGGFDKNIFLNAEDIELSYRYKLNGLKNYVYDKAEVIHYHGKSKKKMGFNKNILEYKKSLKSYEYVMRKHKMTKNPDVILKLKILNYFLYTKLIKLYQFFKDKNNI